MTTLQFQTAHAQRQVPLLLLHSPAIVGLSAGIGAVFDGHVTSALWGSLWVVGILVSCWAWAMQRRFGLYVGPRSVEVKAVFGGRQHGPMTSAHPPTLSVESRISMQRIVVTDAFGAGAPVAWLVRMTRRDPVRTLGFGVANVLLMRELDGPDPASRQWRKTGIVWTEHNAEEVVRFLTHAMEKRLLTEARHA